ncbi:DNA repair ATPase [Streptomyces sp. NPDC091281]|uniref:DNA repair ATPase n=1 Tax=Streptomyces sp. NPDC091281 TaxID=3365985 RepID=UPI0037FBFEE5
MATGVETGVDAGTGSEGAGSGGLRTAGPGAAGPGSGAAGPLGTGAAPSGAGRAAAPEARPDSLDAGTYDLLRDRLVAQAAELARRADALDRRRVEEFGSVGLALTGTDRLRTGRARVPRDVVAVGAVGAGAGAGAGAAGAEGAGGNVLLLGGDPASTTGPDTTVGDVFTLHDGASLAPLPEDAVPGLLDDPSFVREFAALYRYYRQATLLRLRRVDGRLLAVFRTGEKDADIRVLRWAVTDDGRVSFLDARGDRDHVLPPAHDLTWTPTTREDHVPGRHPYVSVLGEVAVSTVGGTLTVRTGTGNGNATGTGSGTGSGATANGAGTAAPEGEFSEPVDEPLQSLADADLAYARVGPLILLRVRPYKEDTDRHLVCNTLTGAVVRLDGIGRGCRRLPEDQGVVFPGGHLLATGALHTYDVDARGMRFEREVRSPDGEDVLYVFHAPGRGRTLLLPYHLIRKEAAAPLLCRGWALADDGTLTLLRAEGDEPGRTHPVQRWTSPFVSETHAAARPIGTGPLARIGNADLVRGLADCLAVARTVTGTPETTAVYAELAAACARTADAHHWLSDPGTGDLAEPLGLVRETAEQIRAEYENVRALTRGAAEALDEATAQLASVVRRLRGEAPRGAAAWAAGLTDLRRAIGHLLTLRDTRYTDTARVAGLAEEAAADLAAFGRRAVTHLAREDAFTGHHTEVERVLAEAGEIRTAAAAEPLAARLDELAAGLGTVTEVVAGLDIADATVRTTVLERVADALGAVNRARAVLDGRRRALRDAEGRAGFAAEWALLGQAVSAALARADTPEACEEQLASLLVQLENLTARFAEFDDYVDRLTERREEIHEALSARRQSLADARARRAERLAESADRVLRTVTRRAATLPDADAVTTYFTSDPLPAKVRGTTAELRALGDPVRADELDGRLDAARQEAARALRDRTDLYADGGRVLRLGRHRFTVATGTVGLTLVPHGDGLAFAVTGTDYRAPVTDPAFAATRPYWTRLLPSESPEVYRAEHLAARLLDTHGPTALAATADLPALVRTAAEEAYDEGYERGVHDHDATLILTTLLRLHEAAGLQRHEPSARATAHLFWTHTATEESRRDWQRRARSLTRVREVYGSATALADLRRELAAAMAADATGDPAAEAAAAYLLDELTTGPDGFVLGEGPSRLLASFRRTPEARGYAEDLAALDALPARRQLAEAWLTAYATHAPPPAPSDLTAGDLAEVVAAELCPDLPRYAGGEVRLTETVSGLLGTHERVTPDGSLKIRVDELLARTARFRHHEAPAHRAYQRRRSALLAAEETRLRLDDHRPRVLPSFVRNRLVDEVYLPLIGDSLAKQLGTADAAGGAAAGGTGGLLLLLSPPGYGKTTLMEYVADRLGLLLVKVSGPALGHRVTSLDPAEAPNATARQEIERINFALAAGNNVLLHLDDIQHTSPELLQTFIPLCDATRRVDGVHDGRPHTYDLRGKRFAVCMTGNPYTEAGTRFQIPDMLANRADVWNLGDVLTGKEDAFALSFVENALTAHPVLAPLAGRTRTDLDLLLRLAAGDPTARTDHLTHPYSPAELTPILSVLRHLLTARTTVLAVNAAYIASAARTDTTRTEPPFRLQGSYRTMRRIAERINAAMSEAELSAVIDDHYRAEAQTLVGGAEANLLKLGELRGTLTGVEGERWEEIKGGYVRGRMGG